MAEIKIRSAIEDDANTSTQLIYMTMGSLADYLLGGDDEGAAKKVISRLFRRQKNRYSYQYTNLAIIDGEVAGLILSYPGKVLKSLNFPMVESMIAVSELPQLLQFFYRSLPLIRIKEAAADEYFINNMAIFPKFRGQGIAKFLMNLAQKRAKESGLNKCALTVEIKNSRTVELYQYLGYQIVDTIKVERLNRRIGFTGLYRMVTSFGE